MGRLRAQRNASRRATGGVQTLGRAPQAFGLVVKRNPCEGQTMSSRSMHWLRRAEAGENSSSSERAFLPPRHPRAVVSPRLVAKTAKNMKRPADCPRFEAREHESFLCIGLPIHLASFSANCCPPATVAEPFFWHGHSTLTAQIHSMFWGLIATRPQPVENVVTRWRRSANHASPARAVLRSRRAQFGRSSVRLLFGRVSASRSA